MFSTLRHYQREWFSADLTAGLVVAILLIPQGIAYAFLAGLPPQAGLYAALLPLFIYAVLGTSPSLAVGPAAIVSLMTLEALQQLSTPGGAEFSQLAAALAALTGLFLLLFYLIGLGRWTTFISHSVISGFSSAAAIVIIINQSKSLTGMSVPRQDSLADTLWYVLQHLGQAIPAVVVLSVAAILLLKLWPLLCRVLIAEHWKMLRELLGRSGPLVLIVLGITLVPALHLPADIVGDIPSGLPVLTLPQQLTIDQWQSLIPSALLIALIGYLESLSVATAMARRVKTSGLDANRELLALGIANLGAAVSQAYPVAGGFGRSMVNQAAGARSQLAGLITLAGIVLVLVVATSWFTVLPKALLGAIIVVAVLPLINFQDGLHAWRFQKSDGVVWLMTFLAVLATNAEIGISLGILLSLILYLRRSSEPHIAEIGRYKNSDHFRNIQRHDVSTSPHVLMIRVDENLYFANSHYLNTFIIRRLEQSPDIHHVVLVGSAINHIDFNGYEGLLELHEQLQSLNILLHMAEFKGPVMDLLENTDWLERIQPGQVFFTASEALKELGHV
ncbi:MULTISPECIES: SulP family inorganic anion transporter [unclassified Oceanobacter]|uniref:SulP family inorganic anion transporter n=2 Tax=Gammaproteobacteria TaxID=1236 RepID=UPI0027367595|nr:MULTISPECIES: sulfate permease [unclassified Oceanobacter]MDP2504751.1 sulfate permease [Oceanobacter sp. 3_MG-2023]MDP2607496.1 sulfate permease [Oceanobacter sp. 1_MG-2023]MDP2610764.1 sulfate permease [Oceanobacter sp. 2_MG-2023]